MDPFGQLFQHLTVYQVIICKRCHFAIAPSYIEKHVQRKHPSISRDDRSCIVAIASKLTNVAQQAEDVQYPTADSDPIDELPVFHDGLRCTIETSIRACNYVCRHRTGIQQHCREKHNWKNPRKRRRYPAADQSSEAARPWTTGQACQRFFTTGKWQRYFPIRVDGQASNQQVERVDIEIAEHGKKMLEALFRRFEEAREREGED